MIHVTQFVSAYSFDVHSVIAPFPLIAVCPEECKANRRDLHTKYRDIHKLEP
jgi:hypothetical protein